MIKSIFKDPYEVYGENDPAKRLYGGHSAPEYASVKKALRFRRLLIGIPISIILTIIGVNIAMAGMQAVIVTGLVLGTIATFVGGMFGLFKLIDATQKHFDVLGNAKQLGVKDD